MDRLDSIDKITAATRTNEFSANAYVARRRNDGTALYIVREQRVKHCIAMRFTSISHAIPRRKINTIGSS